MTLKKFGFQLILTVLLSVATFSIGHSQTKMQKDGKYKAKGHHAHEKYHHAEQRKKHHHIEWNHHSKLENTGFSKKKNKRKNK